MAYAKLNGSRKDNTHGSKCTKNCATKADDVESLFISCRVQKIKKYTDIPSFYIHHGVSSYCPYYLAVRNSKELDERSLYKIARVQIYKNNIYLTFYTFSS